LSGRSLDCVGPLDLDSVLEQKGADGGLAGQGREVKSSVVVLVVAAVDIGTLKMIYLFVCLFVCLFCLSLCLLVCLSLC
jgi:hypothetical protein